MERDTVAVHSGVQGWPDRLGHRRWLAREADRILDFYQWACADPGGGFDWLDGVGHPMPDGRRELWINARMVYVYALAHITGRGGAAGMVDHGLAYLNGIGRDQEFGGWYAALGADGKPVSDEKLCYGHAFVLLAASTAFLAGWAPARELLDEASRLIDERFWDEDQGLCVDTYDRRWQRLEAYRGQNPNMHMTEAYLAAADATDDLTYLDRAARIARRLIGEQAASHDWRLPEHYDTSWQPVLDYNAESPDDQFRPFGSTVGHWFEWARLITQLHATQVGEPWMPEAAANLFRRGIADGWDAERGGLIFSVDFSGKPLNRDRYHWVMAEAIGAAALLWRATGDSEYERWYQRFWSFTDRYLIDRTHGGWRHQLDRENRLTDTVWPGKPDAYHAYQATLFAGLDPRHGLAASLLADNPMAPGHAAVRARASELSERRRVSPRPPATRAGGPGRPGRPGACFGKNGIYFRVNSGSPGPGRWKTPRRVLQDSRGQSWRDRDPCLPCRLRARRPDRGGVRL
jgi:sulfoquinovose isomerase